MSERFNLLKIGAVIALLLAVAPTSMTASSAASVGASSSADTTPPLSFGLLSPENGATIWDVPASYKQPFMADAVLWCQEHGIHFADMPTLEWEPSSDGGSGLDHYEVWMDGKNVENLPTGTTKYTTMVSQGRRDWYVVAVDKAGNKRRSNETFGFEYRLCFTPPMGWNSWNRFYWSIDENLIKGMADAMVSSGMKDAGYEYVNLDDGWQAPNAGWVEAHPGKFPSGMNALADYIHDKGLKFGIYTRGVGPNLCNEVVKAFVSWGVDYVKDDPYFWNITAKKTRVFSKCLKNCGRPIVYSIHSQPFIRSNSIINEPVSVRAPYVELFSEVANLWRIYKDITGTRWSWGGPSSAGQNASIMEIIDAEAGLSEFAAPGRWNDPDILEVGNKGLNDTESKSHFSLWCILAAPLLAGNDLRDMSQVTLDILTNKEVIAVDQDPMGIQGDLVDEAPNKSWQVWARPIIPGTHGGDRVAVVLLNRFDGEDQDITVNWGDIGFSGPAMVRDLWEHRDLGVFEGSLEVAVEPHDVAMVTIEAAVPRIEAESISIGKKEVLPGADVTVSVDVRNFGGSEGTEEIELLVNGEIEASENVTLQPKESRTVTFITSKDEPGTYEVSVGGLTASFEVTTVEPARFEIMNLYMSKVWVEPGESLTVSVLVTNTGGEKGPYTVELSVDGQTKTRNVTLDPGASETVSFDITGDEVGTYEVSAGGMTRSFEVVKPGGWAPVLSVAGAVIAIIAVAGGLWLWRKS